MVSEADRAPHWKMWILRRLFPNGLRVLGLSITPDEPLPRTLWVRFGRSTSTVETTTNDRIVAGQRVF
jgi:hypothetical protein